MIGIDVRSLAAIDMWGGRGSLLRRRVILAEFVIGTVGAFAFAVFLLASSSDLLGTILAVWLIGLGANYLPLAVYAIAFSRPGALEDEVASVDVPAQLRHYTARQFWIAVPLLMLVLAIKQR